jgi:hypothetical protein
MKKIISYTLLVATSIMLFTACKKQTDLVADFSLSSEKAFLRVIHVAPSFRAIYNAPDSFNIYVNNGKVNNSFITFGGQFPASGSTQNGYFAVNPGYNNVVLSYGGILSQNGDSIPFSLSDRLFALGKYYSIIITDRYNQNVDSVKMILEDKFTTPSNNNYGLRFIHAVLNDTAGRNIDVYSIRRGANIVSNIKPGQVVDFQQIPIQSVLNDTLYVRRAGTSFNLSTLNGASFSNQRTYTMIYRGDGRLTSGTKARSLANYIH